MTAMIFRVKLTASVHSEVTNFAAPDFVDFRVTHAINTVCASLSYFSFSVFSLILSLFQEKGEGKRFGLSFSRWFNATEHLNKTNRTKRWWRKTCTRSSREGRDERKEGTLVNFPLFHSISLVISSFTIPTGADAFLMMLKLSSHLFNLPTFQYHLILELHASSSTCDSLLLPREKA